MAARERFGSGSKRENASAFLLGLLILALPAFGACGGDAGEGTASRHATSGGPAPGDTSSVAPFTPAPASHGAECADCHEHIVEAWNRTPMARAVDVLAPGEPAALAALEGVRDAAGFDYRFDAEARLIETPPGGGPLALPLEFAIGAGILDRSYAVRRGETIWFAPLERISASGHVDAHLALAPGNAITPGSRAGVPITPECLGCHTDSAPPIDWPLNLAPEHHDGWEPRGLSCAACHGPSDAHAAWQEADLMGEATDGDDPILKLGALSRTAELSICASCHLQGDVRILLEGDTYGPPPPGGDLFERAAIFVAREPTDDVGFVSHVERMLLSECYLQSEMTCTSCHDPHRAHAEEGIRERTRSACLDCHGSLAADHAGPREPDDARDCVDCHMRKTPTFDVAHVEIHDHWIRREPGPPSEPGPLRTMEAPDGRWVRAGWPGEEPPDHHADPGFLMMALTKLNQWERAIALVDVAPGPGARDLALYHHVRANLLEMAGRPEPARRAYERALELDSDYGPAACNLGLLEGNLGDAAGGIARLDALLEAHPLYAAALRNRAVLRQSQGDTLGAIQDLERAYAVTPEAPLASTLAQLYASVGARDLAAERNADARRLAPPTTMDRR